MSPVYTGKNKDGGALLRREDLRGFIDPKSIRSAQKEWRTEVLRYIPVVRSEAAPTNILEFRSQKTEARIDFVYASKRRLTSLTSRYARLFSY